MHESHLKTGRAQRTRRSAAASQRIFWRISSAKAWRGGIKLAQRRKTGMAKVFHLSMAVGYM